ncbi:hypothetical protein KM043_008655 [Ampulex compressa]|nr:hypothetical protein KM043_008655 [Ampulex compressa]
MTEEDTKINTSPTESDNGELLPSNFKFHEFVVQVADTSISGHIIGAEDSYYVWVADTASYTMNDLSLAFLAKCNKPVVYLYFHRYLGVWKTGHNWYLNTIESNSIEVSMGEKSAVRLL